ncbi:BnaCnng74280D, partial [Brassica napus]
MTILRSREIPSVSGKPRPKRQSSDIIQPSTPARKQEPSAPSLDRSSPPTNTFRRRRSPRLESLNGFTEKEVSILVCSNRKSNVGERFLSLRSGKKVANGIETSGSEIDSRKLDLVEETNIVSKELDNSGDDALVRSEEKGKSVMAEVNDVEMKCDEKPSSSVNRRKYTREEKAKGIQVENLSPPITTVGVEEMDIDNSIDIQNPPEGASLTKSSVNAQNQNGNASRNQQFRDFAERNASRFARFDVEMEEEEESSDKEEVELQVEDWPGPFSTAMKIMKDREENTILHDGVPFSSDIERSSSPIVWPPRRSDSFTSPPPRAPSLQELSMRVLVKNADAITSLDYVPDSLRVKLCQLLCDSRRMDVHFLDLLVRGSPTGICVPDCSWLTEEQFTECFKNCDTSNLMVLQLDQCGRCMPDYVLPSTLARSPKSLPMLSSLSLSGACRLSDVGLRALVSVAPAITSINLSQCSLLTSSTIDMLSDSLG